MVGERDENG